MTPELLSQGDWRYVDAPGFAGATYGSQKQFSEIYALRFAAGLAYAVNSRISVGATFGTDYNSNRLQAPYIFQSEPALAGLKTLLNMRTTGYGWNGSLGFVFSAIQKLETGFSWKSRTVIDSTGQASGDAYAQFALDAVRSRNCSFRPLMVRPQLMPRSMIICCPREWRSDDANPPALI